MIREENSRYACLAIDGGPAGCTTAALVAEAGFETLLVERDELPRFHVGESLIPETYWTLKRLGVIAKLERSQFSRNSGFTSLTKLVRSRIPSSFGSTTIEARPKRGTSSGLTSTSYCLTMQQKRVRTAWIEHESPSWIGVPIRLIERC